MYVCVTDLMSLSTVLTLPSNWRSSGSRILHTEITNTKKYCGTVFSSEYLEYVYLYFMPKEAKTKYCMPTKSVCLSSFLQQQHYITVFLYPGSLTRYDLFILLLENLDSIIIYTWVKKISLNFFFFLNGCWTYFFPFSIILPMLCKWKEPQPTQL